MPPRAVEAARRLPGTRRIREIKRKYPWNGFKTEHRVYHEDAVLEYPRSAERVRHFDSTEDIPLKTRERDGIPASWICPCLLDYEARIVQQRA